MSSAKEKLEALRKAIPSMVCKPGCHDCCGPVPWSKDEWDACPDKRVAAPFQLDCPYIQPGKGCAVYEYRPLMCRLFGASADPRLACPHGCGPVLPLTQAQTDRIMQEYMEIVEGDR